MAADFLPTASHNTRIDWLSGSMSAIGHFFRREKEILSQARFIDLFSLRTSTHFFICTTGAYI